METTAANARPQAETGAHPVIPIRNLMEQKPTLRQVFESEESPLLRFAFGLVGQRETAEDLVQEAFLKLHNHWNEVHQPRPWLFRSVRNLALNHIRDHKRESPIDDSHEPPADSPQPDAQLGRLEAIGSLQLLISELDPAERQLIALKYRDNLKYEQISQQTGLSVSNVGYKLHHTLKSLADALRRLGIESPEG